MFNHRRYLGLLAIGVCLVLVSGAAAADPGEFSATISPTDVRPSTPATYTITLANASAPTSQKEATRATIAIPPAFAVTGAVTANASTTGTCLGPPWIPTVGSESIELQAPSGSPQQTGICPGGTLTVVFTANNSASTDGLHTWTTQLFRDAANFVLQGGQPTVRVDGTPPTVAIGDRPNNPSNSRTATFTFSASDTTSCSLDGGAAAACSSPVTYGDLNDGPHTFTVVSTDAAGNSTPDSYAWTVETRSPTAALAAGPPALTNSRAATFVFAADEAARFECQLDGGAFLPCSSPASYQGLADGAHTFAVRPIDAVGNVGAAVSRAWRIDATAPETRVTSGPRSRTTSLATTFTFTASEQAAFHCKLDGAAFSPCTSPKSYSRMRRSVHTFQVRAIDAAGNLDPTPATFRWTIAGIVRRAKTASALFAPRAGARVTAPPLLAWRPVRRASYYNVQLFRGSRKILSAWPTRTRYRLRASWTFAGRRQRLVPGTYRWYVWPRLGRGAAGRYGNLLGQSTFIVRAPARS